MKHGSDKAADASAPRRYRGPQGLGDTLARALGDRIEAGEGVGEVAEEPFLKQWFAKQVGFLAEEEWRILPIVSQSTDERGFEPLSRSLYGWRHDAASIFVLDAKPDNFIVTSAGILPIDLLLTQIPANH